MKGRSEMDFIVFANEFIFAFIEGVIIFWGFLYLTNNMNFIKENKVQAVICLTAYACFAYWSSMYIDFGPHILFFYFFTICLFAFITRTNLYMSMIAILIVILVYGVLETIVAVIILNITNISFVESINNPLIKLKVMTIIRPVQFLIFLALSRIKIKNYLLRFNIFNRQDYIISYLLLQLTALLVFFVMNSKNNYDILSFTTLGLVLFSTTLLGVLDFRERLKIINIEKQFDIQTEYIKNMEVVMDAIRKEKHDYANHISTLVAMCLLNEPDVLEKIEFYARKLINDNNSGSSYKIFNTGNKYLDGFLAVKNNKAVENGISFDVDFDTSLEEVKIDDINLTSIIGNIIDNAFDAVLSDTRDNKEKIVSLYACKEDNRYYISISNNGPKIPESNLKKIFENKFSTKAKKEGERGFGLFIVKQLVSMNNGKIKVSSSEFETEFLIEFEINNLK